LEIIASILDACSNGTSKTRVLSQCNMNYPQFMSYLDFMVEAKLISIENHRRPILLRASEKGKEFIKAYNNVKAMLQ